MGERGDVFDRGEGVLEFVEVRSGDEGLFVGEVVESRVVRVSLEVFERFDGVRKGFGVSEDRGEGGMVEEEVVGGERRVFEGLGWRGFSRKEKDFRFGRRNVVELRERLVEDG